MINILYIIRALDYGGAERQLIELVRKLDKSRFAVTVATMYDGGRLRPELESVAGVSLVSLHKQGRWDMVPFGRRVLDLVQRLQPDILEGFGNGANEAALLCGRIIGARVVWGLRVSDLALYGWFPLALFRVGAILSSLPDLIIVNSHAGQHYHQIVGYATSRMVVIQNGIDPERFCIDQSAGAAQRRAWGVADEVELVGIVARFDPNKDHSTFLRAAALVRDTLPAARFVCVGTGPVAYLHTLQRLANELGIADRLIWAGPSSSMTGVYNALDILTSASISEGFSNAIAEAMSCAVPCVATDAGDAALMLGDTGTIVPPRSPYALAEAWHRILAGDGATRRIAGLRGRTRILHCFSLEQFVDQRSARYEQLLVRGVPHVRDSV